MKKMIVFAFASLLFFTSPAQDNKPEANSFGLQYGVSYGGTLNQEIAFSGWLKNGIEVKGGVLLSFSQADSKSGSSDSINLSSTNRIAGYSYTETKSGSITVTPNISVLKHINTKSNIDPFFGGLVSTGINFQTIQTQTINDNSGQNFDHYTNTLTKTPVVATIGLSLVGGVNYFFAKNFAIGVDAGFGFTTGITSGQKYATSITSNSGSNNPANTYNSNTTINNLKTLSYTLNLSGNGGLRFTYYIKVKNHKKTESKM
jgi:hypothetical protein